MALSDKERQRRHQAKLRDPAQLRASVLIELFEICMGRRPVNPSRMRAIELWLTLDQQLVIGGSAAGLGKKAVQEARAKLPAPDDSVWATLLDPDPIEH